jgi:hypothetical protein
VGRRAADDPRDYILTVRLTTNEKRRLDELRGRMPLSKFVRRAVLKTTRQIEADDE